VPVPFVFLGYGRGPSPFPTSFRSAEFPTICAFLKAFLPRNRRRLFFPREASCTAEWLSLELSHLPLDFFPGSIPADLCLHIEKGETA